MRILRASDYKRMPWKNGGGETVEIAVSPEGASLETFDWRISMATVTADGPFSIFPGIDRTLSILSGRGMNLQIEGMSPARLTCESEPFRFPADVATSSTLIDGPIIDLNVMTRRDSVCHRVERRPLPLVVPHAHCTRLLLNTAESPRASSQQGLIPLDYLDCLLFGPDDPPVTLQGNGWIYLVHLGEKSHLPSQ